MKSMTLKASGVAGAMLASALLWTSIGYAAGIRPVHLGLRGGAISLAAHVRAA